MKIREIRELPWYLRRRARMPIARFELISSREPELVSVALNDVVLLDPEDTMAEVKERAARPGVNPRTKEPITIAASKSVVFKPGKALKDAVK